MASGSGSSSPHNPSSPSPADLSSSPSESDVLGVSSAVSMKDSLADSIFSAEDADIGRVFIDNIMEKDADKSRFRAAGLPVEMLEALRPALSANELNSLWSYYDRSHCNSLERSEVEQLTISLFHRVPILFRQMIQRIHPGKTRKEYNALVLEHLPHLMPGSRKEMLDYWMKSLEWNADDRVTREEFLSKWNGCVFMMMPFFAKVEKKAAHANTLFCNIL